MYSALALLTLVFLFLLPIRVQAATPESVQTGIIVDQSTSDDENGEETEQSMGEMEKRAYLTGNDKASINCIVCWLPHTHCSKRFCTVWHIPKIELKDNAMFEKYLNSVSTTS